MMGTTDFFRAAWHQGTQQVLNTFLAGTCVLCDRATADPLCTGCQNQLQRQRLPHPSPPGPPGLPLVAWASYSGQVRQVIRRLKYDGHPAVAQFLGQELGACWRQGGHRRGVVVPIPLHADKLQQRGFNQAELVARWFCRTTGLPLVAHGLQRIQATVPQHQLSGAERQQNVARAFAVNPAHRVRLQQERVWLLDDIFTTGATAQAAAQVLRRHQISVAGLATVALTPSSSAAPSPAPPRHSQTMGFPSACSPPQAPHDSPH